MLLNVGSGGGAAAAPTGGAAAGGAAEAPAEEPKKEEKEEGKIMSYLLTSCEHILIRVVCNRERRVRRGHGSWPLRLDVQ